MAFYRGEPSWVFMNLEGSAYDGRAVCRLRGPNGTTLVSGTFDVDNGSGQFARALQLDIDEVGGRRSSPRRALPWRLRFLLTTTTAEVPN